MKRNLLVLSSAILLVLVSVAESQVTLSPQQGSDHGMTPFIFTSASWDPTGDYHMEVQTIATNLKIGNCSIMNSTTLGCYPPSGAWSAPQQMDVYLFKNDAYDTNLTAAYTLLAPNPDYGVLGTVRISTGNTHNPTRANHVFTWAIEANAGKVWSFNNAPSNATYWCIFNTNVDGPVGYSPKAAFSECEITTPTTCECLWPVYDAYPTLPRASSAYLVSDAGFTSCIYGTGVPCWQDSICFTAEEVYEVWVSETRGQPLSWGTSGGDTVWIRGANFANQTAGTPNLQDYYCYFAYDGTSNSKATLYNSTHMSCLTNSDATIFRVGISANSISPLCFITENPVDYFTDMVNTISPLSFGLNEQSIVITAVGVYDVNLQHRCFFRATSIPRVDYNTSVTFFNATLVKCPAPAVPAAQQYEFTVQQFVKGAWQNMVNYDGLVYMDAVASTTPVATTPQSTTTTTTNPAGPTTNAQATTQPQQAAAVSHVGLTSSLLLGIAMVFAFTEY